MCGICGVVDWNGDKAANLVRLMTPTMRHRGPDDEGFFSSDGTAGRLALGMRRLSIIDLEGGHQPVFNEDGSVAAILNGEIYNFRELRNRLKDRGHQFRSHADSEVVAHAYEEWGVDCVEHFDGMFALAIYDRRKAKTFEHGHLFLARDRLGVKPLYYYADPQLGAGNNASENKRFLFASEVRTLLASGVVPRSISSTALESYLLFGSVGEPMTLVDGVLSLPPGHRMTVDLGPSSCAPKPEAYWTISSDIAANSGNGRSRTQEFRDAVKRVRELMFESVQKHLIADVPVGIFLSSGIDSTSLAALASREIKGVHTFTVSFPDHEFSEAALARQTAHSFGATHQEVALTEDALLNLIDEGVSALDQPSMDGINIFCVSRAARDAGLKVALSGLGGDEVFGGYGTFSRTPVLELIGAVSERVPPTFRSAMANFASAATAATSARAKGDAGRKISALWNDSRSLPHPYFFGRLLFTPPQVARLRKTSKPKNGDALWRHWLEDSIERAGTLDPFTAVTCMESQSYLVNTLLRDTDSMSMANSLEVRVPFLDHHLVEFVTALPAGLKRRKGQTKALLVEAVRDLLPTEVVAQPKLGFTLPWTKWLRGPLRKKVEAGLSEMSPLLSDHLDFGAARGVWNSYLEGTTSWSRPWSLYVLNEWVKKHL
ncbi:MAG TPA: asparagine synthase (glutamine-hydrolyzing) [Pyrinomonadaceae bacterium]|nr:asparagine synthase (glutamine-hydrolyzing) [Pyrinomonadaceae bacterium]